MSWLAIRWYDRRDEPGSERLLLWSGFLLVLGVTCIVEPVAIPVGGRVDLIAVGGFSLFLFVVSMSNKRQIIRGEACIMLLAYFGYLTWRSLTAV